MYTLVEREQEFVRMGYGPHPAMVKVAKVTTIGWGQNDNGSFLGGIPEQTVISAGTIDVPADEVIIWGRCRTGHAFASGRDPASPIFRGRFVLVDAAR